MLKSGMLLQFNHIWEEQHTLYLVLDVRLWPMYKLFNFRSNEEMYPHQGWVDQNIEILSE